MQEHWADIPTPELILYQILLPSFTINSLQMILSQICTLNHLLKLLEYDIICFVTCVYVGLLNTLDFFSKIQIFSIEIGQS